MEINEKLYDLYLKSLLSGKRSECEAIVGQIKEENNDNRDIIDLYEKLFKRSLYDVGSLWEYNKISVAVEHLATAITADIMNSGFSDLIAKERKNKKVVVTCVENEKHQIGGKMVADIFEKNGWDAYFLGANTPIKDLIEFCNFVNPEIIAMSLSVYFNISTLKREIVELQKNIRTPILIGGQALINSGYEFAKNFENVYYMKNLEDVESFIRGVDYNE